MSASEDFGDGDRDSGVHNVFDTKSDGAVGLDINETGNRASQMSQRELLSRIFQIKSNVLLFAQCIPGSVPWGVLFVFLNDFLAQEKGLSVEQATGMISLFGVGALSGVLGAFWGRRYTTSARGTFIHGRTTGVCRAAHVAHYRC